MQSVCDQRYATLGEIAFERARNGLWTARITPPEGAEFYLHSRYDPRREAEAFAAGLSAEAGALLVCGVGLGHHVRAVRRRFPAATVCAVELDARLYARALEEGGDLFSGPDACQLVTGEDAGQAFARVEPFVRSVLDAGRRVALVAAPSCVRLGIERYGGLAGRVCGLLLERARQEYGRGRFEACLALALDARAMQPGRAEVLWMTARALERLGRAGEAEPVWDGAVLCAPDAAVRARIEYERARCAEVNRVDDPRAVAGLFSRVAEIFPDSPEGRESRAALGRIYLSPSYSRVVHALPRIMQVETTNACNLRCRMCPRENMSRPVGFMDPGLFRRIVEEASRGGMLQVLKLYFMGEPVLHRELCGMVRFARGRGVPVVGLQTNATLLDETAARGLLEAGVNDVGISLEKNEAAAYQDVRRGGDYGRVVENVRRLVALRNALAVPARIFVTAVDLDEDPGEKDRFIRFWSGIADRVSFVPLTRHPGQPQPCAPGGACAAGPARVCHEPFEKMTVLWNGAVVPCCVDYDGRRAVGDLAAQGVSEVWLGAPLAGLRRAVIEGRYETDPLCRTCPVYGPGAMNPTKGGVS